MSQPVRMRMRIGSLIGLPAKYKAAIAAWTAAIVFCAVQAVSGNHGWLHLQQLRQKQEEVEAVAFRLERENQRLREHLTRLESDDLYLEKVARERLGWIKPGEVVYWSAPGTATLRVR